MKFLLAAIGSKYIHSNLAVHSLRLYAQSCGIRSVIETAEYTINQNREDILADLYGRHPDAVGFSCYLWNIRMVKDLAADLHRLRPETELWLGGPEASYDAAGLLRELPFVRGVMRGEGEEAFRRLMECYDRTGEAVGPETPAGGGEDRPSAVRLPAGELERVPGLVWYAQGALRENPLPPPLPMARLPLVYEHMPSAADGLQPAKEGREAPWAHKILYYESSRGCPFSCSYCLSSVDKRLRFRELRQVERDLDFFLGRQAAQVKFVDRTFNCRPAHARHIWRYLAGHDNGTTNFHFEIAADLLEEEDLAILKRLRPGQVQLEIGVQSANPETLKEIRRSMNLERLERNVEELNRFGNIHLHLDLIAGLPFEGYESFGRSFDRVYRMGPEQLQLGFLKVLKGSYMYENRDSYGLVYGGEPPYEVLKTRWLSYEELCRLKQIEKVLEIYYNSGQFVHTMERLCGFYDSPFALYEELASYFDRRGLFARQLGRQERFDILWEFIRSREELPDISSFYGVAWRELLVYDYYLRENAKTRPSFAPAQEPWRPSITRWYARYGAACERLAAYEGCSYRQLLHMTHAEVFSRGFSQNGQKVLILFDYRARNPLTNNAAAWEAEGWTNDDE